MKRKHLYRKPDPRNAGLVRVYFATQRPES